jgi:hypothetical protein
MNTGIHPPPFHFGAARAGCYSLKGLAYDLLMDF